MSIKLVVSGSSKESRIVLVGRTGKELLASATFTEPRAKGATLRALKKILGHDVVVEDATTTNGRAARTVPHDETVPGATAAVARPAPRQPAAIVRPRRRNDRLGGEDDGRQEVHEAERQARSGGVTRSRPALLLGAIGRSASVPWLLWMAGDG